MSSWTSVFAAHAGELRAVLARVLGDNALAEDCVQDTAMRLLDVAYADARDPKAFMFQVGYNLARDALRRRSTRERVVDGDADVAVEVASPGASPEATLSAQQQMARVQAALDQLPAQRRRVLWLVRVEGLSLKEAAAQMQITPKTVENHMTQALKQLASLVAGDER